MNERLLFVIAAGLLFWVSPIAAPAANTPPTVEVLVPNGGESLRGSRNITWTALDLDGDTLAIDISYSRTSGSTWTVLAVGETDDGAYQWDEYV